MAKYTTNINITKRTGERALIKACPVGRGSLAYHTANSQSRKYTITHIATGLAITRQDITYKQLQECLTIAIEMEDLIDQFTVLRALKVPVYVELGEEIAARLAKWR